MKIMRKIAVSVLFILLLLSGCTLQHVWSGTLAIMNCTKDTLHVISNVESREPLSYPGGEFDILPGRVVRIAEMKSHSEALIDIEHLIGNYDEAFITVSCDADGVDYSRTWTYSERNNGSKQLFNLDDCSLDIGIDAHKGISLTVKSYHFNVYKEDMTRQ